LPRLRENHSHLIPVEDYIRLERAVADALREVVGSVEASVLENKLLEGYAPLFKMPSSQALLFALRQVAPGRGRCGAPAKRCILSRFLTNEPAVTPASNTGPGLKTMIDAHEASNSIGMELIDCIELPVLVVDRDHRSGPGIWVDMKTYWSYRFSANESAIWRRILKHSDELGRDFLPRESQRLSAQGK
jgi:hypothetical protein